MPSDCWSAGVILYVMLAYVAISGCRSRESEPTVHRGYHPFDFSRGSSCKSWWPSVDVTPSQEDAESQAHPTSQKTSQSQWESASTAERGEGVVKKRIIDGHVDFRDRIWTEEVSGDARELVTMLLVYDYLERATVYGALRSLWIARDEDALRDAYRKRISEALF